MNSLLDVAVDVSECAGKLLKDNFRKGLSVKHKLERHLVSSLDIKADELITSGILEAFPSHSILSEEVGVLDKKSEFMWVVDPLDGTHNYVYGIPLYGVSVGLVKNGTPILGVITLPEFKETYTAVRGGGAFLNGEKTTVSGRCLREALMVYDSRMHNDLKAFLRNLDVLSGKVFSERKFGVASLSFAWIASGRIDAYVIQTTKPYDIAAGSLIVDEAGGRVTDFYGEPWNIHSKNIVASNTIIHEHILSTIE
jgi:myo-inositol-1(or 4)-monophosphatase